MPINFLVLGGRVEFFFGGGKGSANFMFVGEGIFLTIPRLDFKSFLGQFRFAEVPPCAESVEKFSILAIPPVRISLSRGNSRKIPERPP